MDDLKAIAHAHLGDDAITAIVRDFALSTQVIRLYECGFEDHSNDYSAAEMLLMSGMAMPHQRDAFMVEALRKADPALLAALERNGHIERAA